MKLHLDKVTVGYKRTAVLKDVSFTLNSGEVLCILGQNGSGKTTLFKTIMKLNKPLSGTISIEDCDISDWPFNKIAGYIGYIPQNYSSVFPYTALEMVLWEELPNRYVVYA